MVIEYNIGDIVSKHYCVNKTIIKFQLSYFLRLSYSKTITEVTNVKNAEGLSGADKLEMNMSKLDEGSLILSEINACDSYQRVIEEVGIEVSEEEIDYYMDHFHVQPFQVMFMRNFYASCFGNLRDIQHLPRRDQYRLFIILKKYLIERAGYNPDKFRGEQCPLAYILTGNMGVKVNNRIIRNNRFNVSLEENESFQYLENVKYKVLSELRPDELRRLVSNFVTTPFTYVCYEQQEETGKEIVFQDYEITEEILGFIRSF